MNINTDEREDDDAFAVDEDEDETGLQALKYLLFNLGSELYGINIAHVTEIIEMQQITPVPDMPGFIKGVINLRGKVIPVMDLRLRFDMEERAYDDRNCIIVSRIDDTWLALIVDTVAEVQDIQTTDIEQTQTLSESDAEHYVEGVGKVGDRVAVLIDANEILRG